MLKKNLFKISIYSLMALTIFSLSVFVGSQVFAHSSESDLQAEEMTREEFMNLGEARYDFMKETGRLPEEMTKEDFMQMQEDMYSLYEKYGQYGMGPGMMMGPSDCPMHSGVNNSMMYDGYSGGRGFMGGNMMNSGMTGRGMVL